GSSLNDTIQPQKATAKAATSAYVQVSTSGTSASQITSNGTPVNPAGPEGTSALVLAITNAHFEVAKFLVEHGADPNAAAQGWTSLHQLEYTRRPNHAKGLPPPEPTGNVDSLELAKALLAHGANPNARQTREINDGQRNNLYRVGA